MNRITINSPKIVVTTTGTHSWRIRTAGKEAAEHSRRVFESQGLQCSQVKRRENGFAFYASMAAGELEPAVAS
ncbi:hypothetical protein [Stieleria maiorica]|uniref:hypothetical protein n=1 Tax=Stieleria maiorica TaxID=2795974 RepID=UPI0011CC5484|nr:hypothetical protein [Stieleria maiorica]